jgi:hypothetical protein
MAVPRVKIWGHEKLTHDALNAEFDNILNNGTAVAFPLTTDVDGGAQDMTNLGDVTLASLKTLTMTNGPVLLAQSANIAAAATVNLANATGNFVRVTGNANITSFGNVQAGATFLIQYMNSPNLVYNATSMQLPGQANISVSANDAHWAVSLGSSNWVVTQYDQHNQQATAQLTTKGDLLTFSTLMTRLGVGPDGSVLQANSGTSTGLQWKADLGVPTMTAGTFPSANQSIPSGVTTTINNSAVTFTGTERWYEIQWTIPVVANGAVTGLLLSAFAQTGNPNFAGSNHRWYIDGLSNTLGRSGQIIVRGENPDANSQIVIQVLSQGANSTILSGNGQFLKVLYPKQP